MFMERRRYNRMECYMIAQQSRSEEERDFFGTVRNISAGGAMIETDERIAVGSQLDLAFLIEEEERQIWEGKAQVVWARRMEGKTFLGLQFTKPLEEHWQNSLI
ncbi:PilZ domain-containing protein [candidate division FCPU426 bacterium]|nr:PilZ domain-containing protein [candidate division FCPU426 bacterium]